jgi:hemolysin activation/secretion protein
MSHRPSVTCIGLAACWCGWLTRAASAQVVPPEPLAPPELPVQTAQFSIPQDPAPPSQQPLPTPEPPTRLPSPEELLPLPAPVPTTPEDFPPIPQTITVKEFKVTGNTVFTPEDFAKVTQDFRDRPISLTELFQARDAITKLYVDKGYITSGAFIPPQRLRDGTVEIRILEGRLEGIQVTGLRRLQVQYVRSRLALGTSTPLNRNQLLEALQLLQLNPLIASVSAELSAGTRPGQSLLQVTVTEAKTWQTDVTLDNGRSPSVGTDRRQIQLSEANLLGLGDGLRVGYTNTNGSNALDVGYTLPLNPRNGTLSFSYGSSSSNVIEPPFNVLDINSKSRYYELTLRQPLSQSPTQEFALGVTLSRRESEAELLDGIPFPAAGADEEGKTKLTAVRFFQEWTKRSSREVLALRSQFSLGLNALNSTINDEAPDSRFISWRGQAQWVRLLAKDTLLLLRTDVQFADRTLLPLEQFGLGGQDSVRGYRQDALLTDGGLFASAEVRLPIYRNTQSNMLLQLTPFVDFGTAWNRSAQPDPDPNTLASVGVGLRFQWAERLTAQLDWGIPLVSVGGGDRTLQENGIYFSINYRF